MRLGAVSLTEVSDTDLKKLLAAVHRGELSCPLDLPGLTRFGLQHCAEPLQGALRGLDVHGVRAVLVAVFSERRAAAEKLDRLRKALPQD